MSSIFIISVSTLMSLLKLVSSTSMYMSFNIFMSFYLLNTESMQVMQVLSVTHWHYCCIESNSIPSVKLVYFIFITSQHFFRETDAEISSWSPFLIRRIHFNHDAWAVISKVDVVFIIQTDSDNVPIPANTSEIVSSFKLVYCLLRTG